MEQNSAVAHGRREPKALCIDGCCRCLELRRCVERQLHSPLRWGMVPRFDTDTHLSSTSVACLPLDLCHFVRLQQCAPTSKASCGRLRDAQGESLLRLGDDEVWYWQEARSYLDLLHLELGCCAANGPQRARCQRVGRGSNLVTNSSVTFQLCLRPLPVDDWGPPGSGLRLRPGLRLRKSSAAAPSEALHWSHWGGGHRISEAAALLMR
mmetsp:Transcript_9946/g.24009  ORF Transcript_9946/g.24009 Transcript_9946/m.24009 type:complete len:209 (-) Transcript_9946:14-640(-)